VQGQEVGQHRADARVQDRDRARQADRAARLGA
jgi:hypothetical protein